LWGKGEVTFSGRTTEVSGAPTYPRPLQERVPIVVGGGGERRTLKIAAASADAVNVMGDLETLTAKRAVLDAHCADVGRDPSEVELTVLDVTLVGDDRRRVADLVEAHRGRTPAATYAGRVNAGTVDRQVERYRALFAAGVGRAFVALPDLEGSEQVMRFGQVIEGVAAPNG
jgi:alkanesulfonate monooxygenase SsuD/methylene tetrahydromethanopterin reductase-like flavin-dependent oxidoreductase (luciferase family)